MRGYTSAIGQLDIASLYCSQMPAKSVVEVDCAIELATESICCFASLSSGLRQQPTS